MQKIKLFLLADTLEAYQGRPAGGAEKQILALCQKIDKDKFEVIAGCLSEPGRLLDTIRQYDIKTMCFELKRIYGLRGIREGIKFSRLIKKERIDILMTYHFGADIWGSIFAAMARVPVIISNRRDAGFWRKPSHIMAYRLTNRFVRKIIAVSKAINEMLSKEENVSPQSIELLYNGIDLEKFSDGINKTAKKQELGLSPDALIISCVGNIRPIKGHSYLIEAAQTVAGIFKNAHFVFIGKDLSGNRIKQKAASLGINNNVHFLGMRNDIPELLAISDICVLPSLSEGMSNALLEYMAAGKPIVATDAVGNQELIQHRVSGLLAKKADSRDLADKIIELLKNQELRERLANKAKEDVRGKFSIEAMVGKYEKLFLELTTELPPAVVLGLSANGLSIVRSLGRKGIPVIGVGASKNEPGIYSRLLKDYYVVANPIHDENEFLNFLLSLGRKLDKKVALFATADEYIQVISKQRKVLSEYFSFFLPQENLVDSLLDKKGTYELAQELGLAYPKTYFICNEDELKEIRSKINYPCIIKPRFSHLWREKYNSQKVLTAASSGELLEHFTSLKGECSEVLVQEVISGPDENVYELMSYFDQNSKPLAYFTCRKLRQYPPGFGIGCLSESIYQPKVAELGLAFLERIGHKGLAHLEFKIDPRTNQPVFIEANLRTSFIGELSIASGLDLPYIAYKDITQTGTTTMPICKFMEGVKLLNIELDLGSFWRRYKDKDITFLDWVKSFKAKRIAHSYFALDDLKPFSFVYLRLFGNLFRKVFNFSEPNNAAPLINKEAKNKINVLHLISSNGFYGAEMVMLQLAKENNNNGTKSWVGALNNTHNSHLEVIEEARKNRLPAYAFESRGRFDWKTINRLCDFLRDNNIAIVHTHNYKANLIGLLAAKKAKITIVATLHGYIGNSFRLKLYERLDRFILKYFNKVILVDKSLNKHFNNGSINAAVINNGVDVNTPAVRSPQSAVNAQSDLVIGTVGRLSQEKGHKYLLEAFAKIAKTHPNTQLLIVGDGELRKKLESLSIDLGISKKVTFAGFQEDVAPYYQQMDIYVSCSLVEHFPMAILEAMSFKKAIVATNVGGTQDLIQDKVAGLLINPGSADEIDKTISTYIAIPSLRKTYGENAYKLIKENYSLEKMASSYKKIYEEIIPAGIATQHCQATGLAGLAKKIALNILPESTLQHIKKLHYARRLKSSSGMEEIDFKIIRSLVRPGSYVLDIGANIGAYTKLLSELTGPKGKVYSIEPVPATFDILRSNVKALGLKNVELINCAVSDISGTAIMQVPSYETGGKNFYEAHIVNENTDKCLKQIKVETKNLDSLLTGAAQPISFIKCDTEGYELECLKGAAGIIGRFKLAWLIEISGDPDSPGSRASATFQILSDYGYTPYWFDGVNLRERKTGDESINYFFLTQVHLEALTPILTSTANSEVKI